MTAMFKPVVIMHFTHLDYSACLPLLWPPKLVLCGTVASALIMQKHNLFTNYAKEIHDNL